MLPGCQPRGQQASTTRAEADGAGSRRPRQVSGAGPAARLAEPCRRGPFHRPRLQVLLTAERRVQEGSVLAQNWLRRRTRHGRPAGSWTRSWNGVVRRRPHCSLRSRGWLRRRPRGRDPRHPPADPAIRLCGRVADTVGRAVRIDAVGRGDLEFSSSDQAAAEAAHAAQPGVPTVEGAAVSAGWAGHAAMACQASSWSTGSRPRSVSHREECGRTGCRARSSAAARRCRRNDVSRSSSRIATAGGDRGGERCARSGQRQDQTRALVGRLARLGWTRIGSPRRADQ